MSSTELKCGFLAERARRFEAATKRVDNLVSGLPETNANQRLTADSWSICQCLEHLAIAAELYVPAILTTIDDGRVRHVVGSAPYGRGTIAGRFLIGAVDPKQAKRKRYKAPGAFLPSEQKHADVDRVAERVRLVNERLGELILAADGLDLGRLKLATPISRFIRVSLAQAFEIQSLHEARHLDQAEAVARALDPAPK